MNFKADFIKAIYAGATISIGCIVNLKVGGIAGPVFFAFGLITIIHFAYKLYTGTAGFISVKKEIPYLLLVLLGNIVGCWAVALACQYCVPDIVEKAVAIADKRLALNPLQAIILGIGCGYIMTTAVKFAREGKYLPLLFGVPVFILCGFLHCIADAFYYLVCPAQYLAANAGTMILIYVSTVVGNFIGCNLYFERFQKKAN